jgi:hypothetical protein
MSNQQSFASHARFVPGFHFATALLLLGNLVYAVPHLWRHREPGAVAYLGMSVALVLLFAYIRTFAVANQDRIIRLEETLRYERLLPVDLKARAGELSKRQVIGLRFASDGELADLVRQALDKQLSDTDIKRAVKLWRPDHHRV